MLLHHASTQAVLDFGATVLNDRGGAKPHNNNNDLHQTTLPLSFIKGARKGKDKACQRNQEARLKEMALKKLGAFPQVEVPIHAVLTYRTSLVIPTGKCVRVNFDFYRLVRRLHIICFRSTEHPTSVLLPALLTGFKKRTYPEYKYCRDSAIWGSREELIKYEEALELEAWIDEVMETGGEGTGGQAAMAAAKTPGAGRRSLVSPATPGPGVGRGNMVALLKTPGSSSRLKGLVGVKEELDVKDTDDLRKELEAVYEVKEEVKETIQIQRARMVKKLFEEVVYEHWKKIVSVKEEQAMRERTPGLERFEPGECHDSY